MEILLYILLIFFMSALYVGTENRMLITRRYKIRLKNSDSREPLKIIQISDLHKRKYPDNWYRLVSRVKELSPDVILITGDLVSRTETSFESSGNLLKQLCSIATVYCSKGNHELDLSEEMLNQYRRMVKESGGILLENESRVFEKNGQIINIYGADLKKSVYKNEKGRYSGLEKITAKELEESLGKAKDGINILMAHNPFFFEEYAAWGADVTFSGHVHGGVVRVPAVGGLLSPERRFFPKYTKGLYKRNGKYMLVSTGIGKLRVFNPPEILYAETFPAF